MTPAFRLLRSPYNQQQIAGGTGTFSVTVDNSVNNFALTYQWYKGQPTDMLQVPLINDAKYGGVTTPTLTVSNVADADTGFYYCRIDGSNCGNIPTEVAKLTIGTVASRVDLAAQGLRIYPNPTAGELTIDGAIVGEVDVRVLSLTGQTLIATTVTDNARTIDLGNLPPGLYLVELNANGTRSTTRISKQ